jgi:GH35 family endo-1,4-beta-xylanase
LVYAVNAGGSAVTVDGVEYKADRFSTGGSPNSTTDPIDGTTADALYQSERYGNYKYEVPVTNSTYSLRLHFVELYHQTAGNRYFSVAVEGQQIFTDKDLYKEVGHDRAYEVIVPSVNVADGKLTIDISASLDNGTISAFAIYSNAGGKFEEPPPPVNTGKNHKFFVGNITTGGNVRSDFIQYWNQITPENEGKWGSVEGTRDQYNWAPVDRIYAYARQHNIPVKAHTFVWGAQSPGWLNNLNAADTAAEIEEWIRDYCTRYPDTAMIDVVNEAVPGHQPAGYAQRAYGNNWIVKVFQLARQYCPNSILILNDYNNIRWQHNEFITLAKAAIPSGYVDAIGLQAHELKDVPASTVKQAIDNLWNQLQVPIYISEYDIGDTNDQNQLKNFQEHFPVFYNHPHVKGITIWGYVVNRTWITGSGLIQENGTQRPAMTWLMNYIKQNPKQ